MKLGMWARYWPSYITAALSGLLRFAIPYPLPMTLFDSPAPLAERIRPRSLDEVVGQGRHLLGPGKPLRRLLERLVAQYQYVRAHLDDDHGGHRNVS